MAKAKVIEQIEKYAVADESFSLAFDSLSDLERGWLKKSIAQLYNWYYVLPTDRVIYNSLWRTGFFSTHLQRARQWALVIVKQEDPSPGQVLAAVFPPLIAGVTEIFVVIDSSRGWNKNVLTALELAGIELVLQCSLQQTSLFLEALEATKDQGMVIFLGEKEFLINNIGLSFFSENIQGIYLKPPQKIGIWGNGLGIWDLDTLVFIHPETCFEIWDEDDRSLPAHCSFKRGHWSEFLDQEYDALFVPSASIRKACSSNPLVLGPGQESCWLWPNLYLTFCYCSNVGWSDQEF